MQRTPVVNKAGIATDRQTDRQTEQYHSYVSMDKPREIVGKSRFEINIKEKNGINQENVWANSNEHGDFLYFYVLLKWMLNSLLIIL